MHIHTCPYKHLYYSYGIYLQKYCGLYTTINSKFRPELRAAFEIFVLKKSCALNYERSQLCGMQLSAVGEIMDHIHLSWERIDILYSSNCLNSQYNHIYNHKEHVAVSLQTEFIFSNTVSAESTLITTHDTTYISWGGWRGGTYLLVNRCSLKMYHLGIDCPLLDSFGLSWVETT